MIDTMLQNPHMSEYLLSLEPDLPDYLENMRIDAAKREVPIIRREAQSLLRFLVKLTEPKQILEVGTAIGFSACVLSEFVPNATITTIEKVPARIEEAKSNFEKYHKDRITLLEGDAAEVLKQLTENGKRYDFIFLDAAKAQYGVYYPYLFSMMNEGAVLVTDNIFQEGSLADSKFMVTRRNRTIHMRMREYVNMIVSDENLSTVLLPVGDGMALSIKKPQHNHI